jgi:replicative DNA helicase
VTQTIPYNENFEKAVLCGILADPSIFPRISSTLTKDDFFKSVHRDIYEVLQSLEIDQIDSLTVGDKLQGSTKEYFQELVKESDHLLPSLTNILFYSQQIKGDSRLREGIELGREIIAACLEPNVPPTAALQKLEDMFSRFVQNRAQIDPTDISTKDAFEDFIATLGTRAKEDPGVRTGFYSLDLMLHKLEGLLVLAARASVGKTAMAINIARYVAETKPVVFFSLEQTREQIFERILASESEVSLEDIRTGAFMADDEAINKIRIARDRLVPVFERMHVDDEGGVKANYITSIARKKKLEYGDIGLIIVDYLHIMTLDSDQNKTDGLGTATKQLRDLGKELNCPILLLSQLNRAGENAQESGQKKKARRPELSDLRSSGEIEQSADIVVFLYRDSYYDEMGYAPDEDMVEVIVRKNRNGRTGVANLKWTPRYVKFSDL